MAASPDTTFNVFTAYFVEYDRVAREIERLKSAIEEADVGPSVLVTCSEPNLSHTGVVTVAAGTAASSAAGPLSPHISASQSAEVVGVTAGKFCYIFRK